MEPKPKVFHGLQREDTPDTDPSLAIHVERLEKLGYTILPNHLSTAQNDDLRQELQAVYAQECEAFGLDNLAAIDDLGVCRNPFMVSEKFRNLLKDPFVTKLMRHYFGDVYILNVQRGVINQADEEHPASVWHREPAYQNFTTSKPISFSVIYFIDGSTPENGGVHILEGSHRFETFPSDQYVLDNQEVVQTPPGSLLVFDSALMHRGGQNRSRAARHSLVQIFTHPLIKQTIDYPACLGGKFKDDPELAMLLGYTTAPLQSDQAYRERRLKQIQG